MKPFLFTCLALVGIACAEPAVPPARVLPRVAFTIADFVAQTPRSANGDFLMEVPQLVNLSLSEEARGVLSSRPVETVGQFAGADGRPRVLRSLISCCAAHARQYEVEIQFEGAVPSLMEMGWVKIIGTVAFRLENGKSMPVIVVKQVVVTDPPQNPLLR